MDSIIIIGIILVVISALVVLLHVPTSVYFLSILAGKLLSDEFSLSFHEFINRFAGLNISHSNLILFSVPIVLTILLTRSASPKSKILFNFIGVVLSTATLIYYIEPNAQLIARQSEAVRDITFNYQKYVVGAALIYALVNGWFENGLKNKSARKKHKN